MAQINRYIEEKVQIIYVAGWQHYIHIHNDLVTKKAKARLVWSSKYIQMNPKKHDIKAVEAPFAQLVI